MNATLALRYELEALAIDYWHDVDLHGGAGAADHYTDDAVFQTSVREYRGRAEIEAFYRRRQSRGPRVSLHVVNNFRIEVESASRVRCGYVISLYAADGEPVLPSKPPILLGLAEEVVVKQADGRWRYASRRIRPLFRDDTPTTG
jgi:hypothetical protein